MPIYSYMTCEKKQKSKYLYKDKKAILARNTSRPKTNQNSTLLLGQLIFYASIQHCEICSCRRYFWTHKAQLMETFLDQWEPSKYTATLYLMRPAKQNFKPNPNVYLFSNSIWILRLREHTLERQFSKSNGRIFIIPLKTANGQRILWTNLNSTYKSKQDGKDCFRPIEAKKQVSGVSF